VDRAILALYTLPLTQQNRSPKIDRSLFPIYLTHNLKQRSQKIPWPQFPGHNPKITYFHELKNKRKLSIKNVYKPILIRKVEREAM